MTARYAFLALLLTATPAIAQLPAARLSAVSPPGAQAGSTVDVALAGVDLDAAATLTFSHPGITARIAGDAKQTEAKFTITVAKDVPVGVYDCRVAGRFGVSNPRAFAVSDRPDAKDAKPGTADKPGKLPLNETAVGRTTAATIDFWAVDAKAGQRVLIECQAREIDSRLNPSLAVVDATGRELDRSRRTGLLDFTAPADGSYTIKVSDGLYRGGSDYVYRLTASTGPRVDHVFPPVGVPGTTAKFTLVGRNLPGGTKSAMKAADGKPLDELAVEIEIPKDPAPHQRLAAAGLLPPSGTAIAGFAYRFKSDAGLSNAVPIHFAAAAPTLEAESATADGPRNDAPESAQKLSLPTDVVGRFYPRSDRDYYAVEAKKGDVYYVEITSDRFGIATAPAVVVQRVKDDKVTDVLESPDEEPAISPVPFRIATRDPTLKWDVKEDGQYRILVRDRFGATAENASAVYRLSVRKPDPNFAVLAAPLSGAPTDSAVWSPTLRRGGFAPVRVAVLRRDGHSGDVTVTAEGLPEGVTAEPLTVPAEATSGLMVFACADDAKPAAAAVRLIAKGKVADADVEREAVAVAVVWGTAGDGKNNDATKLTDPVVGRVARGLSVGVVGDEVEPMIITAADPKKVYEAPANGKLSIPLKVKRNAEQKAALKLKVVGIDGLKAGKDLNLDAKADSVTLDLDLAGARLAPGTYTFCVTSPNQVKYARPGGDAAAGDEKDKGKGKKGDGKDANAVVYSAPITIKVTPAEKKKG